MDIIVCYATQRLCDASDESGACETMLLGDIGWSCGRVKAPMR